MAGMAITQVTLQMDVKFTILETLWTEQGWHSGESTHLAKPDLPRG